MRIELGAGGKIIGTRRVSPNGQVSGLRELAGKEVLVILPGEPGKGFASPEDYLKDLEDAVQEQVKRSLEGYLALQKLFIAQPEMPREGEPNPKAGSKSGDRR